MTEIINQIKNRDQRGLSQLYDKYAASIFGIISRIIEDGGLAEEVLQQTFLKAWNAIDQFNSDKGSIFTWLAKIARNKAIDQVRLKRYDQNKKLKPLDGIIESSMVTHTDTNRIDSTNLLGMLDPKNKEVLDLIYLQGYSHRDVADLLKIPLGTVKSRLRIGIRNLREELKSEDKLFLSIAILLILIMLFKWM